MTQLMRQQDGNQWDRVGQSLQEEARFDCKNLESGEKVNARAVEESGE